MASKARAVLELASRDHRLDPTRTNESPFLVLVICSADEDALRTPAGGRGGRLPPARWSAGGTIQRMIEDKLNVED
jgi:hypothetical protein